MLKIGDFSKLTHVSVRMLRYYDNQGLLKPSVTDPVTGYRMYSAVQVPELQKIVLLRDLNFGVAETKELLQNWNDQFLIQCLQDKIQELEEHITVEKKRIGQIRSSISHIEADKFDQYYNVTIKSIPSYPVISLRRKMDNHFEEGKLWAELMEFVGQEHIDYDRSSQNNVAVYHDEEHLDSSVDIEVCLFVKRLGNNKDAFTYRTLDPVDKMACMMVYGPYENIAAAYRSFADWLDKNQPYAMDTTSRQVTIIDHLDTDNPEEYLTEIQIPLIEL
ncbi:MerR family transcriptional regulator [Lacrimispora saccharolytica]|uniref:Transcriptional regulator, MerR family n=1 Tax=Lacrimispora saccharolytica (strain ATCC 35040 / DSM 2544 / NRCC 2533 / WM1) TaxID=610130 RepID=D9R9J3_LACSW|nr:MerR family transcriptional regulator [Lacrimispora saccharolytica]ADL04043.1 transcriptional regulator, MerR family [[Clostridium] saccharolyticum WM1]QRV21658.1 MerR family transcriptional regulator [Lacrimispora saccharolytica]